MACRINFILALLQCSSTCALARVRVHKGVHKAAMEEEEGAMVMKKGVAIDFLAGSQNDV
jgi:hypothetical protein